MAVLIKIRFEFTLLIEPQNDVKIEFINLNTSWRGAIEGVYPDVFFCLQVCGPITGGTGL